MRYNCEAVLSDGTKLQGSEDFVWPSAEEIERLGGVVMETDDDGTPLLVLWKETGQLSLNGERLSLEEMVMRMEFFKSEAARIAKEITKKKKFWQL